MCPFVWHTLMCCRKQIYFSEKWFGNQWDRRMGGRKRVPIPVSTAAPLDPAEWGLHGRIARGFQALLPEPQIQQVWMGGWSQESAVLITPGGSEARGTQFILSSGPFRRFPESYG